MVNIFAFIFINFVVGFISDIVLNDLSTHFNFIPSLKEYFYKQSILKCAFEAGLTIVVALIITMIVSKVLFRFFIPNNLYDLFKFIIVAFILGYILDIAIDKMKIFGNRLDAYYKALGAGLWGAVAFVFAIIISYFIQKTIIPLLL